MKKRFAFAALVISLMVFGGIAGFLASKVMDGLCSRKFEYINTDFTCGKEIILSKVSMFPFREEVLAFIEDEKKEGRVEDVSVYFRDLRAGPVFGINELDGFAPASLLKLPLALAYLRLEEENPGVLQEMVKYTKNPPSREINFKPKKSILINEPYTIEEVLRHMIQYSDNVSYGVLDEYIYALPAGERIIEQMYHEFGVADPRNRLGEDMSTHGYSSIFRLLYNVSYTAPDLSEKLLKWLSNSDFDDGLVAGVPEDVRVAHKFGERSFEHDIRLKQLHDCGIIYYPDNPYVLCIMTRGREWSDLKEIISTISNMVYVEMDGRRL